MMPSLLQGLPSSSAVALVIPAFSPHVTGLHCPLQKRENSRVFQCTFILNEKPLSDFVVGGSRFAGGSRFPAFSGMEAHKNKRSAACHPDIGPIPPGRYYIFDRQSGGRLGALRERFGGGREGWFALYREDDHIDDTAICESIERGNFRIHPRGPMGISRGCITIESAADFQRLSTLLRSISPVAVKGSQLKSYGIVTVS